jgi:hypothetical protein
LLLYRRMMDRIWKPVLALVVVCGLILGISWLTGLALVPVESEPWLLGATLLLALAAAGAYLARTMAYVQARADHLRLVTPFLRLRISYRRIRSVHPSEFHQLFPPQGASWAQRRILEPFYGTTAVVVELISYPFSPRTLRLFLAPQMFSPQSKALVLLVPDWMALSTEIDSLTGYWLQNQGPQRAMPGSRI